MQEKDNKTTKEISLYGAVKHEWLIGWGYKVGTQEAEDAWSAKLLLDERVSKIPNPNKPHGRLYDLPGYESPVTGKWIEGRKARKYDLESSGCVEYEPSLVDEQKKRHAQEDAQLDKKVDEIVEKTIYEMPSEKREQLVSELENSEIEVTRV